MIDFIKRRYNTKFVAAMRQAFSKVTQHPQNENIWVK